MSLPKDLSVSAAISLVEVDLTLGQDAARVPVLKNISLNIAQGETVSLLGPSGSGKSTLLMTLAGLERPDKGSVVIAGTNITQLSEDRLARFRGEHIGIVFQSFLLIPTMNALENVAIPLELAGKPEPFQRAREALDSVGLSDRLTHFPKQLSGGEQQRVAIARALCMNPLILAADEPTGNLDSETGLSIADLIFMQQKIHKTTLILATHDESLAARCSRRLRLKSGSIISDTRA